MDFLTSTFSSLGIASSDYTKETPIALPDFPLIWQCWQGTVRKDGTKCTILECTDLNRVNLANNLVQVLKKLRLPGLPKILGAEQTQKSVLVALERIVPLARVLEGFTPLQRVWGLSQVLTTLQHCANAKCIVGNTHLGTVWVSSTGDWVLTGFEIASFPEKKFLGYGGSLPYQQSAPPEASSQGWAAVSGTVDTFQFGKLMQGVLAQPNADLQRLIARCVAAKRPSIRQVPGDVLGTPLSAIVDQLAQFQIMNDYDFTQFLRDCGTHAHDFSTQFLSGRLLPSLISAYGQGQKGGMELVRLVLYLCDSATAFDQLTAFIVSLFSSLDRAVRVELLQQMPRYIKVLPDKVVQRNIMPAMAVSFVDSEPMMRKESLNSIGCLAPKLNARQLNGDLLRLLAKTNNDTDADIRAQTVKVLTDLSQHLDKSTRSGVIVTALAKSLKDPSPSVREAALEAVSSTSDYFNAKECAEKLLGPTASALLDPRHEVRALGREIVQNLLDRINTASEKLDESLETGAPPPERVVSRNETPSVAKLFRSAPTPAVPDIPKIVGAGAATAAAPAEPVPKLDPPKNFVVEEAVFSSSGWDDDWDEPEKPERPVAVPASAAKSALKPKSALEPKAAPAPAPADLEPEDDGEDGWGDW